MYLHHLKRRKFMRELIVGSRESKLAMIQTKLVINQLKESGITQPIKIEKNTTKGDKKLTMIQTKLVNNKNKEREITQPIKIEKIETKGDKILNVALDKVGGTNIFINDLETLLKDKKIDFAVHSMKDLNADMDPQFT